MVPAAAPPVGMIERLPKWFFVIPMVVQWFWLALRYHSLTLPTAANPAITAGGLVGEGKLEYLAAMGPLAQAAMAPCISVVSEGAAGLDAAEAALAAAGLAYPMIAKPDIGWCGFGVRLLRDRQNLGDYLERFPRGERVVLQHFLPQEGEAGLFYVRQPGDAAGRAIAMVLRRAPQCVGDGISTVAELIARSPRLRRLGRDGLSEPCCDPGHVPAKSEVVRLATIGSTRVGGLYEDATALVSPQLSAAIDALARDMPEFHVGRFDLRFEDLAALTEGRGFKLMEVNGVGSEAVHAWDPKYSLRQVYAMVFAKQRLIFAIGGAMRRRGHRPIGVRALARLHLRQQRLIRRYPPSN
jgi:hypothetical protein